MKGFRNEVTFKLGFEGRVGVFLLKREGRTLSDVYSGKMPVAASVKDGPEVGFGEQGDRQASHCDGPDVEALRPGGWAGEEAVGNSRWLVAQRK